jgi:hypothetical protein
VAGTDNDIGYFSCASPGGLFQHCDRHVAPWPLAIFFLAAHGGHLRIVSPADAVGRVAAAMRRSPAISVPFGVTTTG